MVDIKKQYQTRDGRKVTLFTTSATGLKYGRTVVGVTEGGEYPFAWKADGSANPDSCLGRTNDDLIEVPQVREGWVNVYPLQGHHESADRPGGGWEYALKFSREQADKEAGLGRVACIKIQFTDGEGLNG